MNQKDLQKQQEREALFLVLQKIIQCAKPGFVLSEKEKQEVVKNTQFLELFEKPVNVEKFLDDDKSFAHHHGFPQKKNGREKNTEKFSTKYVNPEENKNKNATNKPQKNNLEKDLLKKITQYNPIIPNLEKYREILFARRFLDTYLESKELCENERLMTGVVQPAFVEFRNAYTKAYLQELEAFEADNTECWRQKEAIEQTLAAIAVLDNLPELGKAVVENLEKSLAGFYDLHPKSQLGKTEKEVILRENPYVENFSLGTPLPSKTLKKIQNKIEKALEGKIIKIQELTMQKIFASDKESDARKLLDLIQVSQMKEIVALLLSNKKANILHTIRKLLLYEV